MRVGVLIRSYHSTQYLPLVLKQYKWTDKIVVLNYRFKNVLPSLDNTDLSGLGRYSRKTRQSIIPM